MKNRESLMSASPDFVESMIGMLWSVARDTTLDSEKVREEQPARRRSLCRPRSCCMCRKREGVGRSKEFQVVEDVKFRHAICKLETIPCSSCGTPPKRYEALNRILTDVPFPCGTFCTSIFCVTAFDCCGARSLPDCGCNCRL